MAAWSKAKKRPSGGRAARAGRAAAARRARQTSSSGSGSSRSRRGRRWKSRRRRGSIAGRSRACGRPGRSRAKPLRAFYYITDVDPSWPAERQDEHLRDFSYGALWAISIHEVFPGHFLHYQHLRQVESKLRKSILFSSTAFVEGWAHYCEQMMVEEGFRKNDHDRPARAACRGPHSPLPPDRRHPAALRGHVGRAGRPVLPRGGVPRGGQRAPRGRARHVRSRLHSLHGRQADDPEAAGGLQGARRRGSIRCAGFHDALLANGTVPLVAAPGADAGRARTARCSNRTLHAPLRIPVREMQSPLRADSEVLRPCAGRAARSAADRSRNFHRRPRSSSRGPAGTSPTTRRSPGPTPARPGQARRATEGRRIRSPTRNRSRARTPGARPIRRTAAPATTSSSDSRRLRQKRRSRVQRSYRGRSRTFSRSIVSR